jgi:hypothetical protein
MLRRNMEWYWEPSFSERSSLLKVPSFFVLLVDFMKSGILFCSVSSDDNPWLNSHKYKWCF